MEKHRESKSHAAPKPDQGRIWDEDKIAAAFVAKVPLPPVTEPLSPEAWQDRLVHIIRWVALGEATAAEIKQLGEIAHAFNAKAIKIVAGP